MTKYKLLFILALVLVFDLAAQQKYTSESAKAIKLFEKAIEYAAYFDYARTIEKLELAIKADSMFIEAYLTLADIYSQLGDTENEIRYYKKGLEINPRFFRNGYLNLGRAEFSLGKYKDAKEDLETFIGFGDIPAGQKMEAEELLESCAFSIQAVENPVPFNPVNLGGNINTRFNEYWPSLTADGKTLIYTSYIPRNERNIEDTLTYHEDFFVSQFKNGQWQKSRNMGDTINTLGNEGAQSISSDGNTMYFAACSRRGGMGSCDIFFAEKQGNGWGFPINIGRPINTGAWESQPSISPDGRTLYYSSNRTGGKGRMDLWKSTLDSLGNWGKPVNLGDSINTENDEMSPYIHTDNQTLFFSSNGRVGLGKHDLFYSKKNSTDSFSLPINLGYPINTWHDEKGLVVRAKGDMAYFSSDRLGNNGDDIYEFELYQEARPVPVSYVKGNVFDAITKDKLMAECELIDLSNSETVMKSASRKPVGEFMICLPSGRDYALNVAKEGYLFYSGNFSLEGLSEYLDPFEIDVPLFPIMVGKKIVLRNIFFETDSYLLKGQSKVELDIVLEFMRNNPRVVAEIGGHTDDIGSHEDNLELSENRANSVANYLIEHNINPNRLIVKGYGETKPIATNQTEQGRAQNRRTEFTIVGN